MQIFRLSGFYIGTGDIVGNAGIFKGIVIERIVEVGDIVIAKLGVYDIAGFD